MKTIILKMMMKMMMMKDDDEIGGKKRRWRRGMNNSCPLLAKTLFYALQPAAH